LPTGLLALPESLTSPNAWRDEGAEPLGEGEWLLRYRRVRSGAGSAQP
jgi:5-amino-6-(5-phosphoribosylamino)uracil reductase